MGGYFIWGLFPIYWKWLDHVPAFESLLHRTVWSLVFVMCVLLVTGRLLAAFSLFRRFQETRLLFLSALVIGSNWYIYIWAVAQGHIVDASMGYFLSPLLSVLLGWVVFTERLRVWQWVAVLLAATGVAFEVIVSERLPWIGLFLAFSFAAYGALRKLAPVDSITGLFVETVLLTPLALIAMMWLHLEGTATFMQADRVTDLLLVMAGVVTAVPLLLFAAAARRLPLSTVGLLNYITPTLQFLLGVWVFGEALPWHLVVAFVFIWCGLCVYTWDSFQPSKRARTS